MNSIRQSVSKFRPRCCRRCAQLAVAGVRYASANTKAVPDLVNPTPVAGPSSPTAQSSVPAGTILRGIGYHQDRPEPVALPDEEYPSWLWKLLETSPQAGVQPQGPANKATKVVPQSSTADGFQATVRTRDGPVHINKRGLRQKNREDIKASNYLKGQ